MSIWKSPRNIEDLNGNRQGTLIGTLGILFTEIGEDFVRGTMPVDPRTLQPYGLLHGGASVALAETLGSMGASMCVKRGALNP
jgi:1,4-dihydroxy-2-naphthoyl-CoA hydrolase